MTIRIGAFSLGSPIYQTSNTIVYRGERVADGLPVVVKLTRREHPSMSELARLRHEYSILKMIDSNAVARALSLEPFGNGLALVEEDAGNRPLSSYIRADALDVGAFLRIAIAVTRAVEEIHRNKIIHKDLKPDHIFMSADGNQAQLIDFGIASRLSQEKQNASGLDSLEGSLAYMSPEQTGRMNRLLDRRSDLYSLGVTLYQLLTQSLPFDTQDPLELVHAHIAKVPFTPQQLRKDVPPILSEILMKLLAKVAEDRYQDAGGLRADLERCLADFEKDEQLTAFPLGQRDARDQLRIPQKLYAREGAAAALLAAFEQARAGAPALFLVSGAAGSGKSALVHELQKQLVTSGRFIAGKFDQLNRSVPYAPIAHGCAELISALLTEPGEALNEWRRKLLAALGQNGRVLSDVVPELELIIGAQPEVPALGPSEAQNRFELVVRSFFDLFTNQHPLVLFLDDLQWAEPASLKLIEQLLTQQRSHLLVIGSFRDSEVNAVHPLTLFLRDLEGKSTVGLVHLEPLELSDVEQLLKDTLASRSPAWAELARVILRKTQGNPFFINLFLRKIFEEGLLVFDTNQREWRCEIDAVDALLATDNVVDLLINKLGRLSAKTQYLLQLAACIGHEFDARKLSLIAECTLSETAACLWEALEAEVVVPTDQRYRYLQDHVPASAQEQPGEAYNASYRFLHDRVQQAAYSLIAETSRAPIHLSIGRLMLADDTGAAEDARLFEIVGHMNMALPYIVDVEERLRLARLNVRGSKRARDAAAPSTAIALLKAGLQLLGDDPWHADYDVAYQANLLLAECAYLNGDAEEAMQALDTLEARAGSVLARVPGRSLRALMLTNMGRLAEACDVSVATMRLLGIEMPSPEDKAALGATIGAEFGGYQAALAGRTIESLADLPMMTDPVQLALGATFAGAIPAAYQSNQELMVVIVLKAVKLPIQHGTAAFSPFFYAMYGIAQAVITGDQQTSYRFGKLGIEIGRRLGMQCSPGPAHFIFAGFLAHWCAPLSGSTEHFRLGVQKSLEHGDVLHAAYSISMGHLCRLFSGENLELLDAELGDLVEIVGRRKDVINGQLLLLCGQAIAALRGRNPIFGSLTGGTFDEAAFEASAPPPTLAFYGALKAMLRFLAGDVEEALSASERFQPLPGIYYHGDYKFYHALAAIRLARDAITERGQALLASARADAECLRAWAALAPANHAHREALVLAELAALEGNDNEAMIRFEEAISGAEQNGFVQHQALANELCGRFHLDRQRPRIARVYLLDAHHCYERWGATAKVQELVARSGDLLQATEGRPEAAKHSVTLSTATVWAGSLDMVSAMRATKAIASELVLDKLLDRLLRLLVENAGAQRGFLVVPSGDQLHIEASIAIDPDVVETGLHQELGANAALATQIVQYVAHRHEAVVLGDASSDRRFANDPYVNAQRPKSVLCIALLHQGLLSAVLYLENNVATDVFSPARVERIGFLAAHAAVALENAKLYAQVQAANESLEHKVEQRTLELRHRNRDMRLVLDNVNQGFLTIDLKGKLAQERSDIVNVWLGSFEGGLSFAAYCRRVDPQFADRFAICFEALLEEVLPLDLYLEQLPSRLKSGERELCCTYFPIQNGSVLEGLLIVINDLTEEIRRAQEEAEQREQFAVFQAFARDRRGLLAFFAEAEELMRELDNSQLDLTIQKRLLHTLKGNASLFGLKLLAQQCQEAEDRLFAGTGTHTTLAQLRERWHKVCQVVNLVVGERGQDMIEISRRDVHRLADRLRGGASPQAIVAELKTWQLEAVERPLARLAEHGRALAQRLGKAELSVEIEDNGLRIGVEESSPLWAVSVHLVRNAVDHGIEDAAERRAKGKTPVAHLRLSASVLDSHFQIEVVDDGRGIAWDTVSQLAEHRGLPVESRADLVRALFTVDFSTRSFATDTSGRGVGLCAVQRQVEALGGTLEVESEQGRGCRWLVAVPCSAVAVVAPAAPLTQVEV